MNPRLHDEDGASIFSLLHTGFFAASTLHTGAFAGSAGAGSGCVCAVASRYLHCCSTSGSHWYRFVKDGDCRQTPRPCQALREGTCSSRPKLLGCWRQHFKLEYPPAPKRGPTLFSSASGKRKSSCGPAAGTLQVRGCAVLASRSSRCCRSATSSAARRTRYEH